MLIYVTQHASPNSKMLARRVEKLQVSYIARECDASVSRTTSVVLSRVFDAHYHNTCTVYEYSA